MKISTPTDIQQQAITCTEPNIAVFGVPGSGKTTLIVERIAHILREGTPPERIACITSTNAAGRQVERLLSMSKPVTLGYCGTIQGLLLRRFIQDPISVVNEADNNMADRILDAGAEALREPCYDGNPEPIFYDLLWDEYEDVGWLTHEIFLRLPALNRFVTSSYNQSIFGWRGAIRNIAGIWAYRLPPQAQFQLGTNYRCGPTICAHASRLLPHPHMAPASEHADYVHVQQFWRDGLEIQAIAADILTKPYPDECAVMLRTNALLTKYRLLLRGLGATVVLADPKTRPDDYERVAAYLRRMATPSCETPQYDWNTVGDTVAAMGASADMIAIVNAARLNLQSLWEIIAEMQYLDLGLSNASRLVHTSTIHAAKGLEFDYVYLPAFEQGIIPSAAKYADLEEERRLAYVALTRARKGVWISYCDERAKPWGNGTPQPASPSQFIEDMTSQSHE